MKKGDQVFLLPNTQLLIVGLQESQAGAFWCHKFLWPGHVKNKLGLSWDKLKLSLKLEVIVNIVAKVRDEVAVEAGLFVVLSHMVGWVGEWLDKMRI